MKALVADGTCPSVSVIIPAHDEAPRLAGVLAPLATTGWITERIVVDDGSSDGTAEVAECCPGVQVVRLAENLGKGAAMWAGIRVARGEIVVFLDGDLLGLQPRHVALLVRPLIAHRELSMTIGRFVDGRLATDVSQALAPILNGQRALRREFLEQLPDLSDLRYGVETFLTRYARRVGAHVRTVRLPGLTQVLKEEKAERLDVAAQERIAMYREAVNGWSKAGQA
jgi:glycosyltransferase involved in cell wall biosynthesis